MLRVGRDEGIEINFFFLVGEVEDFVIRDGIYVLVNSGNYGGLVMGNGLLDYSFIVFVFVFEVRGYFFLFFLRVERFCCRSKDFFLGVFR